VDSRNWLRQPSTIVGLGVGLGTAAGVGASYATGNAEVAHAVAGVVVSAGGMAVNEAVGTKADTRKLLADLLSSLQAKNTANLPAIGADAVAAAKDIEAAKPLPEAPAQNGARAACSTGHHRPDGLDRGNSRQVRHPPWPQASPPSTRPRTARAPSP
jgi:hypothetical protein